MIDTILQQLRQNLINIIVKMGVEENVEIFFETPKEAHHGDYSTNVAMRLAKILRKNPQAIANEIIAKLDLQTNHVTKCEVAGAGFINFFFDRQYLSNIIFQIIDEKDQYGSSDEGNKERINIEFVSANPTGYLHIGHGRGAAYGDALARILRKVGYDVDCEHYVNDAGNQINNLAYSIYERYKELLGLPFEMDQEYYQGPEIITIAKIIYEKHGDAYISKPWYDYFREFGVSHLLNGLRQDLLEFNVAFDIWFSEKTLYDNDEVRKTLQFLIDNGFTYEKDGAIWLKSSDYGDEKDRVLVKSDKTYTYILPDIAYHANKLSRGYSQLIDVLGADHHGYINRLKAAIACIGGNPDKVAIEILQMVRVIQNGEEIKMSKRSGKAITLRDMMDEIGTDALRFMYAAKALSTPMDLDLDLAIKQSNDNPVYYAQYGYARISSLLRTYEEKYEKFIPVASFDAIDLTSIEKLIMIVLQYPSVIKEAANKRIPHRIVQYVLQLATALHSYYNDEKIITENKQATLERLTVLYAVQIVIQDSLQLIGVSVKEKM